MKRNSGHKASQGWNSSSSAWEQVLSSTYSLDTYSRFWPSSLGYVGFGPAASRLNKSGPDITDSVWAPSASIGRVCRPIRAAVHWWRPFRLSSMSCSVSSPSSTSSSLYVTGSSTPMMLENSPYFQISYLLPVDRNMILTRSWPRNMNSTFQPTKAIASFTWVLCLPSQLRRVSRDLLQHSHM